MTLAERILALLDKEFYGNSLHAWILFVSLVILMYFGMRVLRRLLRRKLPALKGHGRVDWEKVGDYFLRSTRKGFLFVLSLWFGARFLNLSPEINGLIQKGLVLAFLFQAAIWGNFLINFLLEDYAIRQMNGDADKAGTLKAASGLLKLVVWVALGLFALDNMGVNVTTLIAGLGIGGVAIGLASQKILSDLFSSITIILDKPFVQGDPITVGTDTGTIERIGLKTTRIRSVSGEEISFPNADLLQSRIRNFRRMYERRVPLNFGVTYSTKLDDLKEIPHIVEDIIRHYEMARFDRAHFVRYGDSSLDFEVIYWIRKPEYALFMDIQQAVNLEIFRRFSEKGIEFAFPTRTIITQPIESKESEKE